jgi:uncharacterized protein YggE
MRLRFLVFAAALSFAAVAARAQDDASAPAVASDRLTVKTHARATAPADVVEVELVVEASGEDGHDAEKKHRDKLVKVLAALTGQAPSEEYAS